MRLRARTVSVLLFLALPIPLAAGNPRAEALVDALTASLDVEKRGASEDLDEIERLRSRLGRAEKSLSDSVSSFLQLVKEGNPDPFSLQAAEEAMADAQARVKVELDRSQAVLARLSERWRRIAALREEIARRRAVTRSPTDPLSGRWEVVINPGPRKGVFRLVLDGTLVSGDYTLDGGFRGSIRGTFIGEKVTLQRIDSERGFDATFYGRLVPAQKRIVGSWEATQLAPSAGPTAGTWVGSLLPERDEADEEKR